MAKLIVHAPTRDLAIAKMIRALNEYKILGVKSSKRFMIDVMTHPDFVAGKTYTNFIEKHMSERTVDPAPYRDLAVAAASAAAANRPGVAASSGGTKAGFPLPWEMIGAWEIGGSIR